MGVSQGCPLSQICNYLIKYTYFHSLYIIWSYQCVKFKENSCVGTNESTPLVGYSNNEKKELNGYSYNLMLKSLPYHIMAELKSIPIMPTHLYSK